MCEQFGESAAIYACKENDNRFLEMLQKHNYSNFNAVLFKAVSLNAINQVKWLLNLPTINVNTLGQRWKTPLYYAIIDKSIELVKLLLENGANPNLKYAVCQNTYLDLAIDCYKNDIEYNKKQDSENIRNTENIENIINLLLEYGAVTSNQKWPLSQ
jgi:ankyrin repeat protein